MYLHLVHFIASILLLHQCSSSIALQSPKFIYEFAKENYRSSIILHVAKEKSENDNKCVFWLINLTVWRGDNVLVIVNLQRWVRPISREPFQQTLIFLSFPPWFFLICINRKHSGKERKIVVLNWTRLKNWGELQDHLITW